jgi:2-dehydro-3-deoxyphosphogluconate aldolase / (4S)-4-hydroxy-2-oxoglutarate aldolase
MIPTGGVNLNTAADYISAGADALGVGGEIISQAAPDSGHTAVISKAATDFLAVVRETRRSVRSSALV